MSQLDQAKKEAKRLFNLAKANQENTDTHSSLKFNNSITIDNLSKAREVLSLINGYKNWHEYEEVLKRKDFMYDKVDKATINKENKNIYENQKYYIQDMNFNTITTPITNKTFLVVEKEHTPIIMGKVEKSFFDKEKKWILNQYPTLITGATGAGRTEALLSMCAQYIENKEGVIYFEAKGDVAMYLKFFGYATQHNRLNDLFCLNFLTDNRPVFTEETQKETDNESKSHSIDPINPMLGNADYFNHFFGRLGVVIHAILKEIHQKQQLMDIESLESILMLNNLMSWYKNKTFNNPEIEKYLIELGFSLELENDDEDLNDVLLNHAIHANKAHETVSLFKNYSHVFKLDCSVDMENIFLERKLLLVLLPALEKCSDFISQLGALILYQIKYFEEKYQRYNTHFQNIVIDEFKYYADCIKQVNIMNSQNNYIFGALDYYNENDIATYILNNAKTNIIMKTYDNNLPNKIKLDLINNLQEFPKIKYKYKNDSFIRNLMVELGDLNAGQAYILSKNSTVNKEEIINNEMKYYCQYIKCEYIPAKYEKKVWLVKHPKPIIYIKNN